MKIGDKVENKIGSVLGEIRGKITKIIKSSIGELYAQIDGKDFYPLRLLKKVEDKNN